MTRFTAFMLALLPALLLCTVRRRPRSWSPVWIGVA